MGQTEVNLDEYLGALWRRWWLIALTALIVVAAGLGYAFISKPKWEVKAAILMAQREAVSNPLATTLIAANDATPLEVIYGVLTSRRAEDVIVEETGINREALRKTLKIERELPQNQIRMTMQLEDEKLGLAVLAAAIKALDSTNREIGFSEASRTAQYLEGTLRERRGELKQAEAKLAAFTKSMKAPMSADMTQVADYRKRLQELDQQLGGVNQQIASARRTAQQSAQQGLDVPTNLPSAQKWRDEVIALTHRLNVAKQQFGPEHPDVVRLTRELGEARRQGQAEIQRNLRSVQQGLDDETAKLVAQREVLRFERDELAKVVAAAPTESLRLQELTRDVTSLTQAVAGLEAEYQQAQIASNVDRVRWSVLDDPYVEEEPVNKRYGRQAMLYGVLGLLLGVLVSLVHYGRSKRLPE